MMMYWREGYGSMSAGWIFIVLFLVVVIVVAILTLIRAFVRSNEKPNHPLTPLQILKEHYARGEVDREEYERKRDDLEK
jgi:putative membrane protein